MKIRKKKLVITAMACLLLAGCAAPEIPEQNENPMEKAVYTHAIQQLLDEELENTSNVIEYQANSITIEELRFDPDTNDRAAAFCAEYLIRPSGEEMPEAMEKDWFDCSFLTRAEIPDGWLAVSQYNYLLLDGKSGEWSVPEWERIGPCGMDYIDEHLELDSSEHHWLRFDLAMEGPEEPVPLMDPALEATGQGSYWLQLAGLPEKDAALFRSYDDTKVFLRYGEQYQIFEQDLLPLDMLPEMQETQWDDKFALSVSYRRHEETCPDGSPGITEETVVYVWNGNYWTDIHTQPVEVVKDTGLPDPEDLAAELPEFDIAVYHDSQNGKNWIRYGGHYQEIQDPLETVPPELHFEDFNGDGERELAVLSGGTDDNGFSHLSVYRWNGQRWRGRKSYAYPEEIDGFQLNGFFQFYEDGTAFIEYNREACILLDLSDFRTKWDTEPDKILLDEHSYTYQDGEILLTRSGTALPYNDVIFTVTSSLVCGDPDWPIYARSPELHSPFEVKTEFSPEQLSNAQKRVLQQFIEECKEQLLIDEGNTEALSKNRFALCDITGDGQKELIIEANYGRVSEYCVTAYRPDGRNCRSFYSNGNRLYDNGLVWEPCSHNQGRATAIWPFDLYRSSQRIGGACAWSSEVDGFPAEFDLDGDGLVFYIDGSDNPVDNDVYEEWWDRCLDGGKLLPVFYFHFTDEIVDSLTEEIVDSLPEYQETRIDREMLLEAYTGVLKNLCAYFFQENPYPYQEKSYHPYQLSDNRFTLFDIDGDGIDELLTEYSTGAAGEQSIVIYGFDLDKNKTVKELQGWYGATFYDNGTVRILTSNNHGKAGDILWPYYLYQYDPETDTYARIALVAAWARQEAERWNGVSFPEEADLDGDGIVYYQDFPPKAEPMDGPAFDAWLDTYLGGAEKIEIPWQPLTEENMQNMT